MPEIGEAAVTRVKGSELKKYNVIKVWWKPNRDTIIGLKPYDGPLKHLFSEGAQIAKFLYNRSGMTINNGDFYDVLAEEDAD